jgi:hypothetical protein
MFLLAGLMWINGSLFFMFGIMMLIAMSRLLCDEQTESAQSGHPAIFDIG